jgi:1-acyl-sn-glycerol-3-phosphate acyltransferase
MLVTLPDSALYLSRLLLATLGMRVSCYNTERIPPAHALLLVSNHRSALDAPLLMSALNRPIRFACHHYMEQVPILREVVRQFGCLPLGAANGTQQQFFQQATQVLRSQQTVGIFPEGGVPMVQLTRPESMGKFQRGFAHLALRSLVPGLTVLPVAIASHQETVHQTIPLQLLQWFDPSEPLFARPGWHPMVVYHQVSVRIGRPYQITFAQSLRSQAKLRKEAVADLTAYCQDEIACLLAQSYP